MSYYRAGEICLRCHTFSTQWAEGQPVKRASRCSHCGKMQRILVREGPYTDEEYAQKKDEVLTHD